MGSAATNVMSKANPYSSLSESPHIQMSADTYIRPRMPHCLGCGERFGGRVGDAGDQAARVDGGVVRIGLGALAVAGDGRPVEQVVAVGVGVVVAAQPASAS
jgi:hypothetical protein